MGGGEREMCELANELQDRGHEVEFYALPFTMGAMRKVDPRRVLNGIPYSESWTHKVSADVAYTFYHPLSSLNFRVRGRKIASFHSQAFFLRSISPSYGLVPAVASYGTRIIGPIELRTFDAIHTHFPQPTIKHRNTYIIPGWVDTNVFKPASAKYDQFTVLFSGRALWQKGWDIYVKLARRMKELGIRFLYVGGDAKDAVIQSLGFQWNASALSQIYNRSHVLMNPVRVDTFGRVAIESMACVPYDTLVSSPSSIVKKHTRLHNGTVVTVETESGNSLTLTPNHPLLTTRGWVPGGLLARDDMLATTDESSLVGERIGDIVEIKELAHDGRDSQASWQGGPERRTLGVPIRLQQDSPTDEIPVLPVYGNGAVLLGGDGGRRRDDRTEEVAWRQESSGRRTSYLDLAQCYTQRPFSSGATVAERGTPSVRCDGLHESLSTLEGSSTLSGVKARALQSNAEIHGGRHESASQGSSGEVTRALSVYPTAKFETITSIRYETARDLRVYNLTTLEGHYSANGIIVHNCGTPVVTTPSVAHVGLNLPFVFGNTVDEYEESLVRLKRLWEDGKPYRRLSRRCNEAAQAFSFKNTATDYEKMFNEVANGLPPTAGMRAPL